MKLKKLTALLLSLLLVCAICAPVASALDRGTGYKNIILMIGDGMGENHLALAKQERGISLYMEDYCDVRGYSKTRSASHRVTDSAAGGTALSSGVRTVNHYVATYVYDPLDWFSHPRTLAEAAKKCGMRSGVITTDTTDGATPASFSAHTSHRSNSTDITTQQMQSDLDLIWGGAVKTFSADTAASNGFTVVTTAREMQSLKSGSRSFGQFDYNAMWHTEAPAGSDSPTLSQMTEKAINLLKNDQGFFLMVEGAHIDKHSHGSNDADNYDTKVANAAEAVEEFDHAIEIAAKFAKRDGNTLVVITADHETGGIVLKDGKYVYTKSGHTNADVPVIVFGCKDFFAPGAHIENRQVSQRIGALAGFDKNIFPTSDPGKIPQYFLDITSMTPAHPGSIDHLRGIASLTQTLFANLFPKK